MMNETGKSFTHLNDEIKDQPFHYTQCGLDDVYLLSGFIVEDTAYGPAFSIKNIEGLHEAIVNALLIQEGVLSAKEIRFLRKHLGMTQEQFGDFIGVGAQMVARYEKGQSRMMRAVELLLRARVTVLLLPDDESVRELRRAMDMQSEAIKAQTQQRHVFRTVRGDVWEEAA